MEQKSDWQDQSIIEVPVRHTRLVEDGRWGAPLPRFNMPLELGVFLARRYGDMAQKRAALILDIEQYRYQLHFRYRWPRHQSHCGDAATAIERVASWLRAQSSATNVPGGVAIAAEFASFQGALPAILTARAISREEMTFGDYLAIATAWITEE
jgi:hypothetical protein